MRNFRDRSKGIDYSLAVSILALIISIIAAWFAFEQLMLSRGQIRSFVQVTEAALTEPISESSFIGVRLKIKNFGQTAAVNIHGEMDYRLGGPDVTGSGNRATRSDIGSMAPGLERTIILTSNRINNRDFPTPSISRSPSIYFFGTIWYTDATTSKESRDDWCFQLTLKNDNDLHRLDLEQSQTLIYKSK